MAENSVRKFIRYVPSGTYYARLRIKSKLLHQSLKTDLLSVAKQRLGNFKPDYGMFRICIS